MLLPLFTRAAPYIIRNAPAIVKGASRFLQALKSAPKAVPAGAAVSRAAVSRKAPGFMRRAAGAGAAVAVGEAVVDHLSDKATNALGHMTDRIKGVAGGGATGAGVIMGGMKLLGASDSAVASMFVPGALAGGLTGDSMFSGDGSMNSMMSDVFATAAAGAVAVGGAAIGTPLPALTAATTATFLATRGAAKYALSSLYPAGDAPMRNMLSPAAVPAPAAQVG